MTKAFYKRSNDYQVPSSENQALESRPSHQQPQQPQLQLSNSDEIGNLETKEYDKNLTKLLSNISDPVILISPDNAKALIANGNSVTQSGGL